MVGCTTQNHVVNIRAIGQEIDLRVGCTTQNHIVNIKDMHLRYYHGFDDFLSAKI